MLGEILVLLIGTKLDLVEHNPHLREVDKLSGTNLMQRKTKIVHFEEISSKDGINVDSAFTALARKLKEKFEAQECPVTDGYNMHRTAPIVTTNADTVAKTGACAC